MNKIRYLLTAVLITVFLTGIFIVRHPQWFFLNVMKAPAPGKQDDFIESFIELECNEIRELFGCLHRQAKV